MCVEPQVGREVLITLLVRWNKSQSAPNIQTLSDPVKEEGKRKIYTCMNVPKDECERGTMDLPVLVQSM